MSAEPVTEAVQSANACARFQQQRRWTSRYETGLSKWKGRLIDGEMLLCAMEREIRTLHVRSSHGLCDSCICYACGSTTRAHHASTSQRTRKGRKENRAETRKKRVQNARGSAHSPRSEHSSTAVPRLLTKARNSSRGERESEAHKNETNASTLRAAKGQVGRSNLVGARQAGQGAQHLHLFAKAIATSPGLWSHDTRYAPRGWLYGGALTSACLSAEANSVCLLQTVVAGGDCFQGTYISTQAIDRSLVVNCFSLVLFLHRGLVEKDDSTPSICDYFGSAV